VPNPNTPADAIGGRLIGNYGAAAGLAALIGTRAYPSKPTQEPEEDYVTFWQTGGGDGITLAGPRQLKSYDVRVEATATTQARAAAILNAVAAVLDGWQNKGIGVQGCFAVGDADETVQDDGRQVSGQTFQLWFKPQG
jgi:hypothetical protein